MERVLDLKVYVVNGYDMGRLTAVYLFLEMLEFWRILSLKIFEMLYDEFLYDESLKSYHSHIYICLLEYEPYI